MRLPNHENNVGESDTALAWDSTTTASWTCPPGLARGQCIQYESTCNSESRAWYEQIPFEVVTVEELRVNPKHYHKEDDDEDLPDFDSHVKEKEWP